MQTLILQEPGRFTLTDTEPPDDTLQPGEALVRVRRVGICGTDLHAYRGEQPFFQYPRILGHELGVEVMDVAGDGSGVRAGDACAVEPYMNCGHCIACRSGKTNCCATLNVIGVHSDGGMREFIRVPAHKLHPSGRLSLDQLALVEMLCIGAHAVRRAQIAAGETALVVGAGPIGLSVVLFARLAGARVGVLERDERRLRFCRDHLDVADGLLADGDVSAKLTARLGGDLPTVVFDATGSARSMHQAFGYVASGGRLVLVGLVQADITFHDPEFHRREMTLLSSRNATADDFRYVIHALESGRIDPAPWIGEQVDLKVVPEGFPRWVDPASGVVKAMACL